MRPWPDRSLKIGLVCWLAVLIFSTRQDVIMAMATAGPLVIVPLGLRLAGLAAPLTVEPRGLQALLFRWAPRAHSVAAIASALIFFQPHFDLALAAWGWIAVAVIAALAALCRLPATLSAACFAAGMLYLPAGAVWLLLSFLGKTPLGFGEPIVLLTSVHFHYAGFAAAIIAGATGRALAGSAGAVGILYRVAAACLITGPALLAAGFVLSPWLKVGAALLLVAGHLTLAAVMLIARSHVQPRFARMLLAAASASVIVAMTLAAVYGMTEFGGRPVISIETMALTHGLLNGVGFSLCGLLAWNIAEREGTAEGEGEEKL